MCGFVGFSDVQAPESKTKILERMMERIVHRGPDMGSHYADDKVGLGFRRLSILDLSELGNQPMFTKDGTAGIVFNGEIYNFMELRKDLEAKGYSFVSQADTEVILYGYKEYGTDIVNKLRGMYAFVIWDKTAETLFAARDIFGIKPFYYANLQDGGLIFGSEIKAFLEHPKFVKAVNPNMLRSYLTFQYAPGDDTFFDGVKCLPQGHYMIYKDGKIDIQQYWDVDFKPDESLQFEQTADAIDKAVHESVQAHQIADVPVGSFLSGGVDSSYIAACQKPEHTFSVGFGQDKFNETNYAAELSEMLGINNERKLLNADECFEAFPDIQYHMDQPQSNPSCVPLWFLAKLAREKVTVVLSGEGADEIFAGYELYADTPAMEKFKKLPKGLRKALGNLAYKMPDFKGRNFLLKCSGEPEKWFVGQANVFPEKEAESVLKPAYQKGKAPHEMTAPIYAQVPQNSEVHKKQYLDMHLWLPGDILLKADKMCMAHSLELRVPFMDKKIMDLAQTIPSSLCIKGTQNKMVFRHAANKTLPDEWANRPKKGFPVPIRIWLQEEKYYNIVKEYFTSDYAAEFFEVDKIVSLLDEHYHGKANNGRKIWTVFTFLTWYKRFFIDETVKA